MHSYYFMYFIILGNNSDNFVLNKYRVSQNTGNIEDDIISAI